tara:strand:- start:207 stop:398 length:192 start_codon:yes stop_codon:yes gene_type:complete
MKNSEKKDILIKIINNNNYLKSKKILNYKGNLLDDNILDSFDIIQIVAEIEKKTKRKIDSGKI